MKKWVIVILLVLVVSGCQVLNQPDMPATLQAENMGYVVEATEIAQTITGRAAEIQLTADASATEIAQMRVVNQVLLATVRAGDPQGVQGVVANTITTPVGLEAGQRWFVKTGTSARVRSGDGCVEDPRLSFATTAEQIYATVRAFNIQAGVVMSAQWYYEGNPVWEDSWALDRNSADICMWFDITPNNVEFQPGSWSVRLFADGFQLEEAMTFSITAADTMMGGG